MEKRLVLMRGFTQAHRPNPTMTDDLDLTLLDSLIRAQSAGAETLTLWKDSSSRKE